MNTGFLSLFNPLIQKKHGIQYLGACTFEFRDKSGNFLLIWIQEQALNCIQACPYAKLMPRLRLKFSEALTFPDAVAFRSKIYLKTFAVHNFRAGILKPFCPVTKPLSVAPVIRAENRDFLS